MSTTEESDLHLITRTLEESDYPQVEALMEHLYPDLDGAWPEASLRRLIREFPDGQIAIFDGERIVGLALTIRCDYNRFSKAHVYDDLTTRRDMFKHEKDGDALYGVDVMVDPEYRGMRLGRRLYALRKDLCRTYNLRAILAGGRIVNYHQVANDMTPEEYIQAVERREIEDPVLNFQLANDFEVKRLLRGYLPEDEKSQGYATLLEWNNILYEPEETPLTDIRKSSVRVGILQWQMRLANDFETWLSQAEYFVDSMSAYQTDFVLFPEFFNAPLMGIEKRDSQFEAIRFLAEYADRTIDAMLQFAIEYNTNIIAGSIPEMVGDKLYNNTYLCRRDGTWAVQPKIHITPHERRDWVIDGGDKLSVFDTDSGRIGILICYDVEFPELTRLLAMQEMDILFVPFWTDTKNAFLRVQRCAQARAIENECYVCIGGSVGNLPQVENVDVQYAQSAVFSPSDFAFPHDAVIAESTPNTEMALIADLDLEKLMQLRHEGSVTNLKHRREELYRLNWVGPKAK